MKKSEVGFRRAMQKQLFLYNVIGDLLKDLKACECNIYHIANAYCKFMAAAYVPSKYFHHNKPCVDKRRAKRFKNKIALVGAPASISRTASPSTVVKINVDGDGLISDIKKSILEIKL